MKQSGESKALERYIEDSQYVYGNWSEAHIGDFDTKILDRGDGTILFQVPIAKYLEPFWVPLLRHFEETRRVITYERRESATMPLNAWDRAGDLCLILDHLGIDRCDFVSHSSGAIAALHFALMYPERVDSLVLMNVAAYYPELRGVTKNLGNTIAQLLPDFVLLPLFLTYIAERGTEAFDIHRHAFSRFRPLSKYMKYSLNQIVMTHDIREQLCHIRHPVLLINRADDRVVSMDAMEYMKRRLPNCAGLESVIGGGHMFHYARAEQIIGFMEAFYASQTG